MGCGGSKGTIEPSKLPNYHPMNKPITNEDDQRKIYEILEYWFCTQYTKFDKENHIKDLDAPKIKKTAIKPHPVEKPLENLEKRNNSYVADGKGGVELQKPEWNGKVHEPNDEEKEEENALDADKKSEESLDWDGNKKVKSEE